MENQLKNTSKESLRVKQALEVSRPILGENIPLAVWRLLRLVAMPNAFGSKSSKFEKKFGIEMGKLLNVKKPTDIIDAINNARIGICNPLEKNGNTFSIEFTECFTCSGIEPIVGKAICGFEVAMLEGAFIKMGYKISKAKETKCMGGLGDTVCRVEIDAK